MPDIWIDVGLDGVELPVNLLPLLDDTDFKAIEDGITFDESGMDLNWNFRTASGTAYTQTNVAPTKAGDAYAWAHEGNGMYSIACPADGSQISNDTAGFGWFSGVCDGVLPWRGPVIGFRSTALNDALVDGDDYLTVDIVQLGGVTQSLTDLKDFADTGYDPATHKVQGVVLADRTTDLTNWDDGSTFTDIPWNNEWDAEVESEVTDAIGDLSTFDPATDRVYLADGSHGGGNATLELSSYADFMATGFATEAKQDIIDGIVDDILEDTADLQGNQGAWATATGFSTHSANDVRDAIMGATLADFTAAGSLGELTNWLAEMTEDDGGTRRYTENALEEAPSGGGGGNDWDSEELNQIRAALGITGDTATPVDTGYLAQILDAVQSR